MCLTEGETDCCCSSDDQEGKKKKTKRKSRIAVRTVMEWVNRIGFVDKICSEEKSEEKNNCLSVATFCAFAFMSSCEKTVRSRTCEDMLLRL